MHQTNPTSKVAGSSPTVDSPNSNPPQSFWKTWGQRALAAFFFALAVLGLILPGLPTTPFLLLTSYFLAQSSPRLNQALLKSRLFGPILEDWQVRGGIRPHVRYKSIATVIIIVGLSISITRPTVWVSGLILMLMMIGIVVIMRLPDAKASQKETG